MTSEKGVDLLASIGSALPVSTREKLGIVLLGGQKNATTESGGVRVHSAGFLSDIDPAVAGLDILLHPSRSEGLGTAVIDAMALGVPPIAFAVGGIPEVIENEVSGILVPPGDAGAFATQLARLAADADFRARLADGAMRKAKTFDAARMTKETEAVYNEVLSG
jgi:glycosyltransferase involved in cell wall biosynthesis